MFPITYFQTFAHDIVACTGINHQCSEFLRLLQIKRAYLLIL